MGFFKRQPEEDPRQVIVRLGHQDGQNVTVVGFGYQPGHDDIRVLYEADYHALNEDSKRRHKWLHALPENHQPYFHCLVEVDDLWPFHSTLPPAWVSCPDHPDLERALAEHFSQQGFDCKVGENQWV